MGNNTDKTGMESSSLVNEGLFEEMRTRGEENIGEITADTTLGEDYSKEDNDLAHVYLASMTEDSVDIGDSYLEEDFGDVMRDSIQNSLEENELYQSLNDVDKATVMSTLTNNENLSRAMSVLSEDVLFYDDGAGGEYLSRNGQLMPLSEGDNSITLMYHTNEGMNSKPINDAIQNILNK